MRKFARTTWGVSQSVLQTSTLAPCYCGAQYCAPVWNRLPKTKLLDVELRESMKTIGGCLKPTPIQWFLTISSITPPHFRREDATRIEDMADNIPFKQILQRSSNNKKTEVKKPLLQCKD
ncbi:RNA-directed DNA polymerase from mobile element jockey-like [Elysia marginata]|uniref:RNA-directed DNA polymerase from mobile element jockey-like n=1 Tax=Elysia marginata TaxID=1093978 RepID=A0AAV4F5I6_9GAST|nr:RNA-directed DNA polymerase from mobile element jockey-like [Elysia marginata]